MSAPAPEPLDDWIVALDVGGGSVKSGTFAPSGRLVNPPAFTPIASRGSAEEIFATLAGILEAELACVPPEAGWRAALGFPGPFDYANGVSLIRDVDKYDALFGLDVGAALRAHLRTRPPGDLRFFNDALAAIVGEARVGAGHPASRVVGITLGTGLGSAFLHGGQPVTAEQIPGVPDGGWLYPCDFDGRPADECFSTRGVRARAIARGLTVHDAPTLVALAATGDRSTLAFWESFGADLGHFLRPYLEAFAADHLLVLGGLSSAWPHFGSALRMKLAPHLATPGCLGATAALHGLRALHPNPRRGGAIQGNPY